MRMRGNFGCGLRVFESWWRRMNSNAPFAVMIRDYRKARRISRCQFANLVHVGTPSVERWENGSIPRDPITVKEITQYIADNPAKEDTPRRWVYGGETKDFCKCGGCVWTVDTDGKFYSAMCNGCKNYIRTAPARLEETT